MSSAAAAPVRRRRPAWHEGWWSRATACPSPNEGERPAGSEITLVVLHSISLPPGVFGGDDVQRFFLNQLDADAHPFYAGIRDLQVSAHFYVRRDGAVIQFVSCDRRAWHAGVSRWRGREKCNDFSIGIELEGQEGGLFEAAQYAATATLLRALARQYPIEEVAGHEHVAPGRKHDPGTGFDWPLLQRVLRRRRPLIVPATNVPNAVDAGSEKKLV